MSDPVVMHRICVNSLLLFRGIIVSNRVGFGLLDASLLMKNVENFNTTVPPQRKCEIVLGSKPLS